MSSTINMIVAQRLVRKVCTNCKKEAPVDSEIAARAGRALEIFKRRGSKKL